MEAVGLRKNEFAVAVVLGAWVLRLRVCARLGSSAAAFAGRRRGLCCCRLIGAVVVLQEVVARQPDLLSRAGKDAQEGNNLALSYMRMSPIKLISSNFGQQTSRDLVAVRRPG